MTTFRTFSSFLVSKADNFFNCCKKLPLRKGKELKIHVFTDILEQILLYGKVTATKSTNTKAPEVEMRSK